MEDPVDQYGVTFLRKVCRVKPPSLPVHVRERQEDTKEKQTMYTKSRIVREKNRKKRRILKNIDEFYPDQELFYSGGECKTLDTVCDTLSNTPDDTKEEIEYTWEVISATDHVQDSNTSFSVWSFFQTIASLSKFRPLQRRSSTQVSSTSVSLSD